jgi:cytochrome b pre-mRNA-processing protein 3
MLSFLFPRLTPTPHKGAALFDAATAKAREPHWYIEGEVPDTIDGRFRVLATVLTLVLVRLEGEGEAGDALSVALTERFIEVMDAEHRELGIGDPTLGKTVRKLVGSVARRVELWRSAVHSDWNEATRQSVYAGEGASGAVEHSAGSLKAIWTKLRDADAAALAEGRIQ